MMHLLIVWSHVCAEKDAVVTLLEFVSLFDLMILCISSVFPPLFLQPNLTGCFLTENEIVQGRVSGPSPPAGRLSLKAAMQSEGKQEVIVSEPHGFFVDFDIRLTTIQPFLCPSSRLLMAKVSSVALSALIQVQEEPFRN